MLSWGMCGVCLLWFRVGLLMLGGGVTGGVAVKHVQDAVFVSIAESSTSNSADPRERLVKEAIRPKQKKIKLWLLGCKINGDEGRELSPLWLNTIRTVQG